VNPTGRRHFFLGAAAALATRRAKAQPSPIGVAMVGVGNRGGHVLKSVLESPGVKVAAICDLKPDRLDRAASLASRDNPKTTREWRETLEMAGVDAVHISTPCDLHVEMAMAALKAGKHVFLEKPVGIEPRSIGELVKLARSTRQVLIVGQQLRSSKKFQEQMLRLRDGLAGDIIMIKAQRHSAEDLPHDSPSADWFFDVKRSGDVLVEMSVHNLDVCNWALNERPERASGFGGTLLYKNDPPGRTNMDGYTLSYEYPSGAKLSYTQVFFHPRGMPGALDMDSATFYPHGRSAQPVKVHEPQQENLDLQHVTAFFEAIRTGKPVPAGIDEGASGALTAILGREAIYQKRVMNWRDLGVPL
jgi:myo-inositol 2-dehydrogenase/D-chiro-inositol 1-dehydrogenase